MEKEQDFVSQYLQSQHFASQYKMKTCHICQLVVKTTRSKTCNACRRTHCYPCIIRCYPDKSQNILPQNQTQALEQATIQQCFCCLKMCKCTKCNTKQSVIVTIGNIPKNDQQNQANNNLKEDEPISQFGLFKDKKVVELPNFMQRIYYKKKTLYSKHLMSAPSNNNLAHQANSKVQQKTSKQKGQYPQNGEQADMSEENQASNNSISRQNQMEIENQNENDGEQCDQSRNSSQSASNNQNNEEENENEEHEQVESIVNQCDENEQLEVEQSIQPQNQAQVESHSLPNDLNAVNNAQSQQPRPSAVMSEPNVSVHQSIEPMQEE